MKLAGSEAVPPGEYSCEISEIQREQNERIDGTVEQGATVRNSEVFASEAEGLSLDVGHGLMLTGYEALHYTACAFRRLNDKFD